MIEPVKLKVSKFTDDKASKKRVKKKVTKLKRLVEKKIPKTDSEIEKFIEDGKREGGMATLVHDIPIDVFALERGLNSEFNGKCTPLTLRFGTVECTNGLTKGSVCKHKCIEGYRLHRMSPASRTCLCSKWGCVWMRKAKAKCQKLTKGGRKNKKVELPMCVHIAEGKKVLIRSHRCMCPSGWRNRDKCSSPNVDHTGPCTLIDPYNSTDSERHQDSNLDVELICNNKPLNLQRTEFEEHLNETMAKIIVPGHTTIANFKNSHIYNLDAFFLEGAYKLSVADFSQNFMWQLPFDLFKKNHVITRIDLSENQLK